MVRGFAERHMLCYIPIFKVITIYYLQDNVIH